MHPHTTPDIIVLLPIQKASNMTILERRQQTKCQLDLAKPEGNAFQLIAIAETTAKKLGMSKAETEQIVEDMQSDDYEHLINVFDKHFGMLFDLIRP